MNKHHQSEMKALEGNGEVLRRKSIKSQYRGVEKQWGGGKRRTRGTKE